MTSTGSLKSETCRHSTTHLQGGIIFVAYPMFSRAEMILKNKKNCTASDGTVPCHLLEALKEAARAQCSLSLLSSLVLALAPGSGHAPMSM